MGRVIEMQLFSTRMVAGLAPAFVAAILSVAAFVNTTRGMTYHYGVPADHAARRLVIPLPADQVIRRFGECRFSPSVTARPFDEPGEYLHIRYETRLLGSPSRISALLDFTRAGEQTTLELAGLFSRYQPWNGKEPAVLAELADRMRDCFGDALTFTSESDRWSGSSPSGTSAAPSRKSSSPAPAPPASRPASDRAA